MASFFQFDLSSTTGAALSTSLKSSSIAYSDDGIVSSRAGAATTHSSTAADIDFAVVVAAMGLTLGAVLLVALAVCCCYRCVIRPLILATMSMGG